MPRRLRNRLAAVTALALAAGAAAAAYLTRAGGEVAAPIAARFLARLATG